MPTGQCPTGMTLWLVLESVIPVLVVAAAATAGDDDGANHDRCNHNATNGGQGPAGQLAFAADVFSNGAVAVIRVGEVRVAAVVSRGVAVVCPLAVAQVIDGHTSEVVSLRAREGGLWDLTLKKLKKKMSIPIIFLTSKDDEVDELLGLKLGADDFVKKWIDPIKKSGLDLNAKEELYLKTLYEIVTGQRGRINRNRRDLFNLIPTGKIGAGIHDTLTVTMQTSMLGLSTLTSFAEIGVPLLLGTESRIGGKAIRNAIIDSGKEWWGKQKQNFGMFLIKL